VGGTGGKVRVVHPYLGTKTNEKKDSWKKKYIWKGYGGRKGTAAQPVGWGGFF